MSDNDFYEAAYDAAEAECKALRAERDRLREILKAVPDALNSALQAGMEEREGGSANRQEQHMKPVDELRAAVRAALAKEAGK